MASENWTIEWFPMIFSEITGELQKQLKSKLLEAKLIAEWHFGIGSVANTPNPIKEEAVSAPQNPRLDALKRQKDNATQALKAERARVKIQRAQQQITTARQSLTQK